MSKSFFNAVFDNLQDFKDLVAIEDYALQIKLTYDELHQEVLKFQKSLFNSIPTDGNGVAAILTGKNIHFIIAQLACNSLNIPFLPLDSSQEQRNLEIIQSIKPMCIISSELEIQIMPNYSEMPPHCEYAIFSSGSTGKPKGILMKGAPAINIVSQQAKIIDIQPSDKYLWLLSPAFDASLSDIYSTFVARGTLVIPNFATTQIKQLCLTIEKHLISYIDLPPSMFNLFSKTIKKHPQHKLKGIVFGGESAPENITKDLATKISLFQAYGPTETTICSSMIKIKQNSRIDNIGQPLSGVTYKVENNELLISGDILSIGYFDNKQLNENKFVVQNGVTWYKTGDCVELIDEQYIYRGRIDRQFKFHSQLICPEEIEAKALKFGASFCHIYFDGKIHMYYVGELNYEKFSNSLVSYMKPHFVHQLKDIKDFNELLNSNHKFDHKKFLSKLNNT